MTYRGLGPASSPPPAMLASSKLRRRAVRFFVARIGTEDLACLACLLGAETIRSVIERRTR